MDVSTDSDFNTYVIEQENVGDITQYEVTELDPEAEYYYRVFAVNSCGNSDASDVIFVETEAIILGCGDSFVDDRDDNVYQTVQIGGQCWMIENLNFDDGCTEVSWVDGSDEGWCGCYDDDPDNCGSYGLLYQWSAIMDDSKAKKPQGLCPSGWHLPSDDDIKKLEMQQGMTQSDVDATGWRGLYQGDRLKCEEYDWCRNTNYPPCGASGFTALPGGVRSAEGSFDDHGVYGYWWTSSTTGYDPGEAWGRGLGLNNYTVQRYGYNKAKGFSVRCLKDSESPCPEPDAPTALDATDVQAESFTANWEEVISDPAVTHYLIDVSTDSDFETYILEQENVEDVTEYEVTGLDVDTEYYYRVYSVNECGASNASNEIFVETLCPEPDAPTALDASDVQAESFTANWEEVISDPAVTHYLLDVSTDSDFETYILEQENVKDVTEYEITGLDIDAEYYYRVYAVNECGVSNASNEIFVETLCPEPDAPTVKGATNVEKYYFTANWYEVISTPEVVRYILDVSTDSDFETYVLEQENVGEVTEYQVTKLDLNTEYFYRVYAYNKCGFSDASDVISVKTLCPEPDVPIALDATDVEDVSFTANWEEVSSDPDVTHYLLDVSTDSDFTSFVLLEENVEDVTEYEVTGLKPDMEYYYRVYAVNECGTSNASNEIFVQTEPIKCDEITFTYNEGTAYEEELTYCKIVSSVTGRTWMDRNLGAISYDEQDEDTHEPSSNTDYPFYGDLFQWGREDDGHQVINWIASDESDGAEQDRETSVLATNNQPDHDNFILSPDNPWDWRDDHTAERWNADPIENNPCPDGWRVPTKQEWRDEAGFVDKGWEGSDDAFNSDLKLVHTSRRDREDGSLTHLGTTGRYWSSTTSVSNSKMLLFYSVNALIEPHQRASGYAVRCIKD